MSPRKINPTTEVRAALYAVGVAVFALTTYYGLTNEESAVLWLGLLGAVLNTLALLNVPRRTSEGDVDA